MFVNFFSGYTAAELITMLVGVIIAFSQVFLPGISILEWAKEKFGLADLKMQWFVVGFFMVLSAGAMWVTGELSGLEFTLRSLISYFGLFYGMSQLAWQGLKVRNGS